MSERQTTTQKALQSSSAAVTGVLLRRCACGNHTTAGGVCDSCRKKRQGQLLQTKLAINEPGDAFEQEADRLAASVVHGKGTTPVAGVRRTPSSLRRQDPPKEKSNEEKMKEGAQKVGEAFLETPLGKDLKERAAAEGEKFLSTLPGKIVAGAAAAGALTGIIASNSELPVGIPEIPLDVIHPGLKMKITYEGPVQQPTNVAIAFSGTFGASPAPPAKTAPARSEQYRAETAAMAADQERFRQGLKSSQERRAEDKQLWGAFWSMRAQDPLNPLRLPRLESPQPSLLQTPQTQVPAPPPDVKLPPKLKREDETVQRKAEQSKPQIANGEGRGAKGEAVPGIVYHVLASSGRPLDAQTRSYM
jgi:hypothetical protein